MTDTDPATTEPVATTEPSDKDAPKQLRDALKREQAKNADLTTQLMGRAYTEAGLDTSKGLGKAIAKEYKGEATSEALLAYAKEEYDYTPAAAPDNQHAAKIVAEQNKLDGVENVSASTVPLTDLDALQKASVDKDPITMGQIKSNQLRTLMKP